MITSSSGAQSQAIIKPSLKKRLFPFVIRLSITIFILYFVLSQVSLQEYRHAWLLFSIKNLSILLLLVVAQVCLLAFRWYLLARSVGSHLSIFGSIFGILMSLFFSQGLPASIGADVFRLWWHRREGIATNEAFKIIFIDRICGMLSLVLICIVSAFALTYLLADKEKLISVFILIISVGVILGAFVVPYRFGISSKISRLSLHLPRFFSNILQWLINIRHSLSQQKLSMTCSLLGTGIMIHLLAVAQIFVVANVLSAETINFLKCLAVVPPALFVSYMPFSIAGWGVREASLMVAFGLLGIASSLAVLTSLTIGMVIFFISLLGGLVWLTAGFHSAYKRDI